MGQNRPVPGIERAHGARVVVEDGPGEVALEAQLELREEGEQREGGVEVDVVGVPHVVLHRLQVQELPHVLLAVAKTHRFVCCQLRAIHLSIWCLQRSDSRVR